MRWLALFLCLAVVGCTQPVGVPELKGTPPTPVDKLVFGRRLAPADIKAIFRALNTEGKFDGLKPLFEEPSEEEMSRLSRVLSRHLYESALDAEGFPALLEERARRGEFSKFLKTAERWRARRDFSSAGDAALAVLSHDRLPQLVRRDISWLSPEIAASVERLRKDPWKPERDWPGRPMVSPKEILSDVTLFLDGDAGKDRLQKLEELGRAAERASLGESLLRATRALRARHRGPSPFEGLAFGFRAMLSTKPTREDAPRNNDLDNLVYFIATATRSTDGFFASLEKRIEKDPGEAAFLSQLFKKLVAEAIHARLEILLASADFWKGTLPEPGKPLSEANRRFLYRSLYGAFSSIRGPHRKKNDEGFDPFPMNLRTELNAFALSLWLEKVIVKNDKTIRAAVTKSREEILSTAIEAEELALDWKTKDKPPAFPYDPEMKVRGFPADTLTDFHAYLKEEIALHYPYRFDARAGELGKAVRDTLDDCDRVLPMGDEMPAVITSLAVLVARPREGVVATLDTPNLMDSLNRLLGAFDLTTVRKVETLIFKKMALQDLEWDGFNGVEEKLKPIFEEQPALLEAVGGMVRSLHGVKASDKPAAAGLPTPFEAYHAWTQSLRPASAQERLDGVGALTDWLGFLSKENAFRFRRGMIGEDKATLEYSALPGLFDEASGLARALEWMSRLDVEPSTPEIPDEAQSWLGAARASLGYFRGLTPDERSGLTLHLRSARELAKDRPTGLTALLDWVWEAGAEAWPDTETLPNGERRWLMTLVKTGDFEPLWGVLRRHLDREKTLALVKELRRLERRGVVTQAFRLLTHVKNDRIRRIADALLVVSETKELEPLLEAVQTLLEAVQTAPAQVPLERATREVPLVAP